MARLNLILINVTLATIAIALSQRLTGVSPLILFAVPPAVVLRIAGFGAALAAAALGATVGDYLFVPPVRRITVHAEGLRHLLLLLLGTGVMKLRHGPVAPEARTVPIAESSRVVAPKRVGLQG
jgi:hypothetical protein